MIFVDTSFWIAAALGRDERHAEARALLDRLDRSPRVRVDVVASELEDEALRWVRRRDEHPYSFVDATSFALMRRLRIRTALAFDERFEVAGFVVLRPSGPSQ